MPLRSFQIPTSIDPWHLALALCDWIGHRPIELEVPAVLSHAGGKHAAENSNDFLVDDFRNRHRLRSKAPSVLLSNSLDVRPDSAINFTGSIPGGIEHDAEGVRPADVTDSSDAALRRFFANPNSKGPCDVRVL
jgi:hypothetical protein